MYLSNGTESISQEVIWALQPLPQTHVSCVTQLTSGPQAKFPSMMIITHF